MALIFRCAYVWAIRHGGATGNELRDPRGGAVVEARAVAVVADGALAVAWMAGGALVSDAMLHPRHPLRESLHHSPAHIRSIGRRLCSSPLVFRILRSGATSQVGLRIIRSGRRRRVVRSVSRGGGGVEVSAVAVTTVDREVLNGLAQLATAVAECMCATTSVTAVAECMCVAVAAEFTIIATAGAAVAAHA